jgi:hypothetical protein
VRAHVRLYEVYARLAIQGGVCVLAMANGHTCSQSTTDFFTLAGARDVMLKYTTNRCENAMGAKTTAPIVNVMAPCHWAHVSQQRKDDLLIVGIEPREWPSLSPDLAIMDFCVIVVIEII